VWGGGEVVWFEVRGWLGLFGEVALYELQVLCHAL
jgi:hypothetical protein